MRIATLVLVLASLPACSESRRPQKALDPAGAGCSDDGDCAGGLVCFQGQCVSGPGGDGANARASLRALQPSIDFGTPGAQGGRSMPVTLENDGGAMVELSGVRVEPATSSFRVDQMGTGPFWIRPGRTREVFVTYTPSLGGARDATLVIESQAPTVRVSLAGH